MAPQVNHTTVVMQRTIFELQTSMHAHTHRLTRTHTHTAFHLPICGRWEPCEQLQIGILGEDTEQREYYHILSNDYRRQKVCSTQREDSPVLTVSSCVRMCLENCNDSNEVLYGLAFTRETATSPCHLSLPFSFPTDMQQWLHCSIRSNDCLQRL